MSTTSPTKPQTRVTPKDAMVTNVSPSKKRKRATKEIGTPTHPSNETGIVMDAASGDYESDLEPTSSLPMKRLKTGDAPVSEGDELMTQAEPGEIDAITKDAELDGYQDDVEAVASSDDDQEAEAPKTAKGKGKAKATSQSKKAADPIPLLTDTEMQAYIAGLATITDWTCEGILPDYCKIIEWIDKDRLETKEVVNRWHDVLKRPVVVKADGKKTNVSANIYKHYKKWSRVFYMKKLGLKCPGLEELKRYLAAQKRIADGLPPPDRSGRKKVDKVNAQPATQKNGTSVGQQVPAPATTTVSPPNGSQGVQQVTASTKPQVDQPTAVSNQISDPGGDDQLDHQDAPILEEVDNQDVMNPLEPQTPKKSKKTPKPPTLDQQLQLLFAQTATPTKTSGAFTISKKKLNRSAAVNPTPPTRPSSSDITRYYQNRHSPDVLYFQNIDGDAILGHPSRPVINRQCALQYSEYLADMMEESPFQVIKYTSDINEVTISRFVACISPSLRGDLPSHDIVEIGQEETRFTEIQWSMKELKELYLLAEELGAWDVVDLVTDRWHAELHRAVPRRLTNEDGADLVFDILDFSPGFLEHLARRDPTGLDIFTDILVMKGEKGWEHMLKFGLESWGEGVKKMLVWKLMHDHQPKVSVEDEAYICEEFHRHHEYEGYVCYKEAVLDTNGDKVAPPEGEGEESGALVEVAPNAEKDESSPVASYWHRQSSLLAEQDDAKALQIRTQGTKRKRLTDEDQAALDSAKANLKERGKRRRKAEEALEEQEAEMPSITISCFREQEYTKYDIYELEEMREIARAEEKAKLQGVTTTVATPAIPGGFIYPARLGNGMKDSKRQAEGKMAMLKEVLQRFQDHGYDVGGIGNVAVQADGDVEMSDGDEEDEDGDEKGDVDDEDDEEDHGDD
jgi:hypothetical protein